MVSKRTFQFSVAALLFATALIGVFVASVLAISESIAFRRRAAVVDEIGERGGVLARFNEKERVLVSDSIDSECANVVILKGLSGEEFRHNWASLFPKLERLALMDSDLRDHDFRNFSDLSHLCEISLAGSKLPASGSEHIGKVAGLKNLDLTATNTSDRDIEKISGLNELKVLKLAGTNVSDEVFKTIRNFQKLEVLDVSFCKISDVGILNLSGHQRLSRLKVEHTNVTNRAILDLGKTCDKLLYLDFDNLKEETGIAPRSLGKEDGNDMN